MIAKTNKRIDIVFPSRGCSFHKRKICVCVLQSSQNNKSTCFDDNFQKAKNILLKPLLLKFIYSERQSLELRPLSPYGGWGGGGAGLGGIFPFSIHQTSE